MIGMMSKAAMVALVVPLWTVASGCGGGGGGATSSSSSTTVSGAVIDGPVSGGTVVIKDSNGNTVATGVTGSDGKYSLAVPEGTSFPLNVSTTGGTDVVTGETAASMDSLIMDATQTTANITPITSVVYQTVIANVGGLGKVTSDVLTSAKSNAVSTFGFGIDSEESGIDPISSPVHSGNITSFMKSAEAMAETVRRAIGTGSTTMVQAFRVIGEDLVDGSMDGKKGGAVLSAEKPAGFTSDMVVSAVTQQKALVGAEVINNSLKVTKSDGAQISSDDVKTRFSQAANRMDPSISTTSVLTKMGTVSVSEKQKNQLTADIGNAKKIQKNLGVDDTAMTSLQTVANNLKVGEAGTDKLGSSVMGTAENAANTVTKGIKEKNYSSEVISSAVSAVSPSSGSTTATTSPASPASSSSSTTASTSGSKSSDAPSAASSGSTTATTSSTSSAPSSSNTTASTSGTPSPSSTTATTSSTPPTSPSSGTPTSSTSTSGTPASSPSAPVSSSAAPATSTPIPASSDVTVRYTGTRTLYGYQLGFTTQSGLTLADKSACKTLLTGVSPTVAASEKTLGAFSPTGFAGPADLFSCTFTVGSSVTQVPQASDYVLSGKVFDENGVATALSEYKITVK